MEVFKAPVLEFKLFGIRFVSHVLTFIWLFKKVVTVKVSKGFYKYTIVL